MEAIARAKMGIIDKNKKKRKKGKFRKSSRCVKLSQEDLEFLEAETKYSSDEITEWFSGFIEDNPEGTLSRVKMLEMYSSVLSVAKATMFVEQIFTKFDTDNDGTIDFKEFMLATNTGDTESAEEKLRWAFRLYDKDSSGTIDVKEMIEIVGNLYEMEGFSKDTAIERSNTVFRLLDKDGSGELDEDEFVRGCLRDERLRELLNSGHHQ